MFQCIQELKFFLNQISKETIFYIILTFFYLILGFIFADTDYNYALNSEDFLSSPFSYYSFSFFIIEAIFILILEFAQNFKSVILIFFMMFEISRLILRPYYDFSSQKIGLFMTFYLFALSVSVSISESQEKKNTLVSFLSCILLPLSYLAAERVVKKYEQIINNDLQSAFTLQELNMQKLDRIMRLPLFKMIHASNKIQQKYKKLINQLNLIVNKPNKITGKGNYNGFEEQYQSQLENYYKEIQSDEMHSEKAVKLIKKLLKLVLKDLFQSTLKQKKISTSNEREQIVYYVFIVEVMGSLGQYWILRQQMKLNQFLSPKQKQIYNSIDKIVFESKADILKNSNNSSNQDPFSLEFIEVIQYEKQLDDTLQLFDTVIRYKVNVLVRMKQKFIDSEELIKDIDKFISHNEKLKNNLNYLTRINYDNHLLYELQHLYLEMLAFSEKDINLPRPGQIISAKMANGKSQKKQLNQTDRFDKFTCIIAAQYEDNGSLIVKHVSKNFIDIFYTVNQNQDIINKNIDQLIPNYLQSHHKIQVNKFIEKKQSTKLNSQKPNRMQNKMIFGALTNCLIVPLQIDIKINEFINSSDFGLCAKVKLINKNKHYLIYSPNSFLVQGLTPRLSHLLFNNNESILKVNIRSFFPIIQSNNFVEINYSSGCSQIQVDFDDIQNNNQITYENVKSTEFLLIKKIKLNNQLKSTKCSTQGGMQNSLLPTNYSQSTKTPIGDSKNLELVKSNNSLNSIELDDEYLFILMTLKQHDLNYDTEQKFSCFEVASVKQQTLNNNCYIIQNHIRNQLNYHKLNPTPFDYKPQVSFKQLNYLYTEIQTNYINNIIQSISSGVSHSDVSHMKNSKNNNDLSVLNDTQQQINSHYTGKIDAFTSQQLIERGDPNMSSIVNNLINYQSQQEINKEQTKQIANNQDQNNTINQSMIHDQSNYQKLTTIDQNVTQGITTRRGLMDESNLIDNNDAIEHELVNYLFPVTKDQVTTRDKSETYTSLIDKKQNENNNNIKYIQSELNQNTVDTQVNQTPNINGGYSPFSQGNYSPNLQGGYSPNLQGNYSPHLQYRSQVSNPSTFSQKYGENEVDQQQKQKVKKNKMQRKLEKLQFQEDEVLQDSMQANDSRGDSPNIVISSYNIKTTEENKNRRNGLDTNVRQQKFFSDEYAASEARNNQIEELLKKQFLNTQQNIQYAKTRSMRQEFHAEEIMTNRKKLVMKQILDKQADIISTSSKKSTFAAAKRSLRQILSARHVPFAIKFSNFIGLISFLTMTTLVLMQYFKLSGQIYESKENKYYSTWPVDFQASVHNLVKDNNILLALTNKTDYKFETADIKNKFMNKTKSDMMYKKDVVIDLIALSSGKYADRLTFQLLKDDPNTFQVGQYYDPLNLTMANSVPAKYKFYSVNYTTSVHFSIVLSYQHTFRYAVGLGTGRPEYYMILNNLNFYYSLNTVQEELLNIQQTQDSELQDELVQVMIIIIVISGVCISIIIPLYAYIQKMREEVVILFSTFNSNKLDELLTSIQKDYEMQRRQLQVSGQAMKFNKIKDETTKKSSKNISITTRLHRIQYSLVFKLLIIFCLVIIYPIVNKLISSEYLTQQTISLRTTCNN